jgi:putative FmdB family regulatory protein
MPIYEYQCQECGKRTEAIQRYDDAPLTTCPQCNGPLKKLISSPSFQFKGSGWYATDYARGSGAGSIDSKKSEGGNGASSSEGGGDAKSSATKDGGDSGGGAKEAPVESSAKLSPPKGGD